MAEDRAGAGLTVKEGASQAKTPGQTLKACALDGGQALQGGPRLSPELLESLGGF